MRLGLVLRENGLKVYGDRAARAEMAQQLIRLPNAPAGEHYEFQTLEWEGQKETDFRAYRTEKFTDHDDFKRIGARAFDLNFMTLEDEDFDHFPKA